MLWRACICMAGGVLAAPGTKPRCHCCLHLICRGVQLYCTLEPCPTVTSSPSIYLNIHLIMPLVTGIILYLVLFSGLMSIPFYHLRY